MNSAFLQLQKSRTLQQRAVAHHGQFDPSVWWPHGPNGDFLLEAQRHRSAASNAIPQRSSSHCPVHRRGVCWTPGHGTCWDPQNAAAISARHPEIYCMTSSCKRCTCLHTNNHSVVFPCMHRYAPAVLHIIFARPSTTHTDNTSPT